jgi:hypothetical protein
MRSPSRNAGPLRTTAACVALWAIISVFVSSVDCLGGLVERPRTSGSVVWSKTDYLDGERLDVQLLRNRTQFDMAATFGMAGFYATVKTETDASRVLGWLRSLRLGVPCPNCEQARDLR